MNDILFVSKIFHALGSLHMWLASAFLAALILLASNWFSRGVWRCVSSVIVGALAVAAGLASLGMAFVEIWVFAAACPLCVGAYLMLAGAFAWLIWQVRAVKSQGIRFAAAAFLGLGALGYLFPFGSIPRVFALNPEAARLAEGSNVLAKRPGALLVTEFADFQCSACAIQDRAMERLWQSHSDQIRYSFRHFPLTKIHRYAEAAALASECAAAQGRFWETKRFLFANQARLGEILPAGALPTMEPRQLAAYKECVASGAALAAVRMDRAEAARLKLRAAPSVVIGNTLIVGTATHARLAFLIERELQNQTRHASGHSVRTMETGCGASLSAGGGCAQ